MIQTTHIVPLRTGWDPNPAGAPWYPDDLPEEWRLGFYSNAFRAVLVPASQWRSAGPEVMATWAADTPPCFRFYLEREETPAGLDSSADPEHPARALGNRLGGLLARASDSLRHGGGPPPRRVFASPASIPAAPGLAWDVPAWALADVRSTRNWIEERVCEAPPGPMLALLGRCRFADLERWQVLIEMMGLA
jgi:hypothetical protein